MNRAREVGHAIANKWDAACCEHEELGWSHGPRCDDATAAVEARDAGHEAEKRALREQLAEAKRNAHESEADYREMRRALDDLRLQLTAVTRERDEARTILTTGLDLLAFIGDEPINNVERKIGAWTRQAREALPFTAARDCQNTTAGCHTPMACESAGRCEWPVPGTP